MLPIPSYTPVPNATKKNETRFAGQNSADSVGLGFSPSPPRENARPYFSTAEPIARDTPVSYSAYAIPSRIDPSIEERKFRDLSDLSPKHESSYTFLSKDNYRPGTKWRCAAVVTVVGVASLFVASGIIHAVHALASHGNPPSSHQSVNYWLASTFLGGVGSWVAYMKLT